MSNKNLNLYITAHSTKYISRFVNFHNTLKLKYPEIKLIILFATKKPTNYKYLPDGFEFLLPDNFFFNKKKLFNEKLKAKILNFKNFFKLDIYRSDLRYIQGILSENQIINENIILAEAINNIFKENKPHLTFVSSGTNILHSLTFDLAKFFNSKVYRIHNFRNLNKNIKGQRVWFCSNNKMYLSEEFIDQFHYDPKTVNSIISDLNKTLINRTFKLDSFQKKYIKRRMPIDFKSLLIFLIKIIYFKCFFFNIGISNRGNIYIDRIKKLINSFRIKKLYIRKNQISKNFIFLPLNTPYDSQVLVRAPEYRDFLSLIDLISSLIPYGYDLVIREHPGFPGMIDFRRFKELKSKYNHLKLISTEDPVSEIIKKSKGVICLNNTVFIETILCNKPIITLANGFFSNQKITHEVNRLGELRGLFEKLINDELSNTKVKDLEIIMSRLFQQTFPPPKVQYDDKMQLIFDGILTKLSIIEKTNNGFKNFVESLGKHVNF